MSVPLESILRLFSPRMLCLGAGVVSSSLLPSLPYPLSEKDLKSVLFNEVWIVVLWLPSPRTASVVWFESQQDMQIFHYFPPIRTIVWKQSFAMKGYCSKFDREILLIPTSKKEEERKKSSTVVSKICLVCLYSKGYLKGEVITHWVWPREKSCAALTQSSQRKCHSDENVAEHDSKMILQTEEIHLGWQLHRRAILLQARYLPLGCVLTSVCTPMRGGAGVPGSPWRF